MVEADVFCFMGLVYCAFVCLCTMTLFWWLDDKPGWEWLADTLVILWIGFSMSVVAWMKVWMSKPSFNTGASFYSGPNVFADLCNSLQYDCDHSICSVSGQALLAIIFPNSFAG